MQLRGPSLSWETSDHPNQFNGCPFIGLLQCSSAAPAFAGREEGAGVHFQGQEDSWLQRRKVAPFDGSRAVLPDAFQVNCCRLALKGRG